MAEEEIHEIHTLISSNDDSNKCSGYSTLLQFQQHSCLNPSSLQSLAQSSISVIFSMLSDISHHDEEIAAQALKCLGFMIYHPSVVSALRVDDADSILCSLAKLITTTKLKSACNLGVWCLSVQQLGASLLVNHFHSLLRAIVHALDNPMGSLSTTFEATQAIMKLSGQLSEQMRESSHIWAPPIYRRLLSTDKREKDSSERCLLKIRSTVIPPSLDLSKVLVKDMKIKLLDGMKNLLDKGMKIQAIRAWGWFVRILGSHAMKNRHLVNDLLKIPERTFTDLDPQVQIATQVAWEGLIDALVHHPILGSEKNPPAEDNFLEKQHSIGRINCDNQANGFSKSIKLIMTPLIGIMSSKCDISVHSSCLNTWCYLLHKLDTSINEPSMMKMVFEPILKAIFQNRPDSKTICLWNMGLDLFSDSISLKCRDATCNDIGLSVSGKCSWKQHSIRWLPWDISQLDFYLNMIYVLFCQASDTTVNCEHRSHVYDAALKLFIQILKGVKLDVESPSTNYDGIMGCMNSLLTFMKRVCDFHPDGSESYEVYCTSIKFIDAITKELGPSVLGSPLYKFSLDLKYINDLQSVDNNNDQKFPSVRCVSYMDKVSPLVYLIALHFYMMVQLTTKSRQSDCISQGMCEYFKYIFSSSDPLENLLTCIGLMYKLVQPIYLNIWITVAQGLNSCVDDANCKSLQEALSDSIGYSSICHFLIYPIMAHSEVSRLTSTNANASWEQHPVLPERKLRLELAIQTWKSLYGSLSASGFGCSTATKFSGDLCTLLSRCLDENTDLLGNDTDFKLTCNDIDLCVLHLSGNFLLYILEQIQTSELVSETDRSRSYCDSKTLCSIRNCLKFSSKYMNVAFRVTDPLPGFVGTSRLCSALTSFISCLHWKQDILLFMEILSCPLLQWLSNAMQDERTSDQLGLLWTEILNSLRRSQPPINFGSSLLRLHEPLFEKTLDHSCPSISEPTINFWNSTFAQQIILDFPPSLLHVLDKLSRNGKLKLQKRSLPSLQKCHSHEEANDALQGYRVTATQNRTSKRVELLLDSHKEVPPLSFKKKRLELTEHQKEVRRAQQGRKRDNGGHGPGIRTYTNADFSQGLDDSQESQEDIIRDSEAILHTNARMATETVFTIASRYGDYIRTGWRNILDCILKLHKLGLLPTNIASDTASTSELSTENGHGPNSNSLSSTHRRSISTPKRSSGLFRRFSQLLSLGTEELISIPTEEQLFAHQQAVQTIHKCHIDNIFIESKFLQAESLMQLARALINAGAQRQKRNKISEDEDASVFCLELLIAITLNNRDRIGLLWKSVYENISNIVKSTVMPCALVEKAVFGLLRICHRLLPYKENITDELLRSLQLILKLDALVADAYYEKITQEVCRLVKENASHIRSHLGWCTVTSLLLITARHLEASEAGFDTLLFIMSDGAHLLPANYILCVDVARQFAESRVGLVDRSVVALDLMADSVNCLEKWTNDAKQAAKEEEVESMLQDIGEMWLRLVQGIRKVCLDQREEVRNHAVLSLQKCMTGAVGTHLPCDLSFQYFNQVIFTLLDDLLEISQTYPQKEYRNMEGTLIVALKLLFEVFLQLLQELSQSEAFCKLWVGVLSRVEKCVKMKGRGWRSEKFQELVPEHLKKTLLVMKSGGILVKSVGLGENSLWELTWLHVKNIAPSLQSEVFPEQGSEQLKLQHKQIETVGSLEPDANIYVPSNETVGQDGAGIG